MEDVTWFLFVISAFLFLGALRGVSDLFYKGFSFFGLITTIIAFLFSVSFLIGAVISTASMCHAGTP
jgi:hypothetical protein